MSKLPSSVVACVEEHARLTPEKTALIAGDKPCTYSALWAATCRFARALRALGVERGAHVLLRASHSHAYVAAYLGTTLCGAAAVPYEHDLPLDEIEDLAQRVGAVCSYGQDVPGVESVPDGWMPEDDALGEAVAASLLPTWADDHPSSVDLAELLLTTGTTGRSKVVALSHGAVMAVEENIVTATELAADNVSLVPMPLNHVFGLRRLQAGLVMGGTVVLIAGVASLKRVFASIKKYEVTSLSLVPSALAYLQQTTHDYLGSFAGQIRFVESSSAPLPTATRDWLRSVLPESRLYNSYGCTESTACCMLEYSKRADDGACVGTPCVTADIKIVDRETGEPTEGAGRVIIGGGAVMEGYWGDEQTTAQTLKGGYVLTNDLGYFENGELYVLGRLDDVIMVGGHNVSPVEVEDVIMACPLLSDCACVRGVDAVTGERLVLFAVLEPEVAALGEEEALVQLRAYLNEHLETFKRPAQIEVVTQIPRTYNGKTDRKQLQQMV